MDESFYTSEIYQCNEISISKNDIDKIELSIQGINNKITIMPLSKNTKGKIKIFLTGDNNEIFIDENCYIGSQLVITMGRNHKNFGKIEKSYCKIGKYFSCGSTTIVTYNSNAEIEIGNNCMFAMGITLYHTDSHPILDFATKKIINKVYKLKICNHVWVGANVTILKNSLIGDNSIVGWGSIVTGKFPSSKEGDGFILAGNPAKIVRRNITWTDDGSNGYVQNER